MLHAETGIPLRFGPRAWRVSLRAYCVCLLGLAALPIVAQTVRPVIDEPRQHRVGVVKIGARLPQPCDADGVLGHGARSLRPAAVPAIIFLPGSDNRVDRISRCVSNTPIGVPCHAITGTATAVAPDARTPVEQLTARSADRPDRVSRQTVGFANGPQGRDAHVPYRIRCPPCGKRDRAVRL